MLHGYNFSLDKIESAAAAAAKLLQSCPTLCDPIDSSPPGSTVPGILQGTKNTGVGCHSLLHGELLLPLKGSESVGQIQASVGNVHVGHGSEKCRLEPTSLLPQSGLPGMGCLLAESC